MFDRIVLRALLAITTVATATRGQTTDDLAQKRRAVEIAARTYIAATQARRQESESRLQLPHVRTYSGLRVRADTAFVQPDFLVRLDSGFARARNQAAALFGVTTDSLLAGAQLILTPRTPAGFRYGTPNDPSIYVETLRPSSANWARHASSAIWDSDEPLDRIATYFVEMFENTAGTRMPPAIAAWMGRHASVLPWERRWRELEHFGLVMHPSGIGLACSNGAIAACRTAFAFVPGGDTLGAWFDAPARRARVVRALQMPNVRGMVIRTNAEAADRCTEIGDDAACRIVLRRIGAPSPTSRSSREHLVRAALQRGGEHAFERLRADSTRTVEQAIVSAAGVPIDSLLVAWRESILAARPPSPAPDIRELVLGIALVGSLVGLTAARKP